MYEHTHTCPFLRYLHLVEKLDYNHVTAQQLYDGMRSFGFDAWFCYLFVQGIMFGFEGQTIDDLVHHVNIEHKASLVKLDESPTRVNEALLHKLVNLDRHQHYISPQSILRFTVLRNVDSWVETSGQFTFSLTGFLESCKLIYLLNEGHAHDFGINRTKLEKFLRGETPFIGAVSRDAPP